MFCKMTGNKDHDAARNRAADFKCWILRQIQPNGKHYSVGSACQYVAQLRNYAHKLAPHALEGTTIPEDLFELNRQLDFDTVVAMIAELPGYGDFIAGNHGNFSAAKEHYHRFLGEREGVAC